MSRNVIFVLLFDSEDGGRTLVILFDPEDGGNTSVNFYKTKWYHIPEDSLL
jgi:hypothetical protein